MSKDLTTSAVARSNVLNNRHALCKLEEHLALGALARTIADASKRDRSAFGCESLGFDCQAAWEL